MQAGTTFAIVFAVFNEFGRISQVARSLTILPACTAEQFLCDDGTCSEVGACELPGDWKGVHQESLLGEGW